MKTKLVVITILLFVASGLLYGQTITHPWYVVDRGGGKSTAGGITLHSSIGQSSIGLMSVTGYSLESGFIPGARILSGASTSLDVSVDSNWNLISVPLILSDYRKTILYPTAVSNAFAYANGYNMKDTLNNGVGYWLKFAAVETVNIAGTSLLRDTVDVGERWNLIGMIGYPVLLADVTPIPPATITSSLYGFSNTSGYFAEDTLKPGAAYWVKMSQAGQLVMKSGSVLAAPKASSLLSKRKVSKGSMFSTLDGVDGIGKLVLKDAKGDERVLYFATMPKDIDVKQYELPPPPPAGMFDVRYTSQRMLEVAEVDKAKDVTILISSAVYPLTIEWQMRDQSEATLVIDSKKISMSGIGKSEIQDLKSKISIRLSPAATIEVPKAFALHQNYPNPFNPSTTIRYDLPKESRVVLKIYNTLGQEVKTIVDEMQGAGFKLVEWDANDVSAGVYFYRISTEADGKSFVDVKKLAVVK